MSDKEFVFEVKTKANGTEVYELVRNKTAALTGEWKAASDKATKLTKRLNNVTKAYEENTQKLHDAVRKAGEYGATAKQQGRVMEHILNQSIKNELSTARYAAIMEELVIELQDVELALYKSAQAMEYWRFRGGRVEEAMEDFTELLTGQSADALRNWGRQGERVANIINSMEDRTNKAKVGVASMTYLLGQGVPVLSKFRDAFKTLLVGLELMGINTQWLANAIKSGLVAALGATVAAISFAKKAMSSFVDSNKKTYKAVESTKKVWKIFLAELGSALLGGGNAVKFLGLLQSELKNLIGYIKDNRETIFDFSKEVVTVGAKILTWGIRSVKILSMLYKATESILGGVTNAVIQMAGLARKALLGLAETMLTIFEWGQKRPWITEALADLAKEQANTTRMLNEEQSKQDDRWRSYEKSVNDLVDSWDAAAGTEDRIVKALADIEWKDPGPINPDWKKKQKEAEEERKRRLKAVAAASKVFYKSQTEGVKAAKELGNAIWEMTNGIQRGVELGADFVQKFKSGALIAKQITSVDGFNKPLAGWGEILKEDISVWDELSLAIQSASNWMDQFVNPFTKAEAMAKLKKDFHDKFIDMLDSMTDAIKQFAVNMVSSMAFAFGASAAESEPLGKILLGHVQQLLMFMSQAVLVLAFSLESISTGNIIALVAAGAALAMVAGSLQQFTQSTSGANARTPDSGSSGADALERLADRFLNQKAEAEANVVNVFIGGKQLRNDIITTVGDTFTGLQRRRAVIGGE